MAETDLESPELFINRELSWLEFNDRVLEQGRSAEVPLMERLKFLAIVSSNLDEFFMIRVAGLKQQLAAGVAVRGISGLSPGEQLDAISRRAHRLVADQSAAIGAALAELRQQGLHLLDISEVDPEQRGFLESYFVSEVLPVLTPLGVDELSPFPVLPGLTLNLAILLGPAQPDGAATSVAITPIPGNLPRFVPVPGACGLCLVRLEQIVRTHIGHLFPGRSIEAATEFRLTRDADVAIDEDEAEDLLRVV
jgi:polyphosphate kinase